MFHLLDHEKHKLQTVRSTNLGAAMTKYIAEIFLQPADICALMKLLFPPSIFPINMTTVNSRANSRVTLSTSTAEILRNKDSLKAMLEPPTAFENKHD